MRGGCAPVPAVHRPCYLLGLEHGSVFRRICLDGGWIEMITLAAIFVAAALYILGQHTASYIVLGGLAAKYFSPFLLTVAALPGRMIAFPTDAHNEEGIRRCAGMLLAIAVQSVAYTAYATSLALWANSAGSTASAWINWVCALVATVAPITFALKTFRADVTQVREAAQPIPDAARDALAGLEIRCLKFLAQATFVTLVIGTLSFLTLSILARR